MMPHREFFMWASAKDPISGKPYMIFLCPAREGEEQARIRGMELLPSLDFQIHRYPTRQVSQAAAYYRGTRLNSHESLHSSSERQGHEKTVNRRLEKLHRRHQVTEW